MKKILKKIKHSFEEYFRTCTYKRRCRRLNIKYKKGVVIGKNVKKLSKFVNVVVSENTKIHDGVVLWGDGTIIIGENSSIGENGWIYANKNGGVTIGNNVNCAAFVYIMDSDHGMKLGVPMNIQPMNSLKIIIGNDVWIGANVTILKGAQIHDGCVIGACSCVTKSFDENSIVCGVPAKKIRSRD